MKEARTSEIRIRNRRRRFAPGTLLLVALLAFAFGCAGGSGGDDDDGDENRWNEMEWDEGSWS